MTGLDIAIVGMGLRGPGAGSVEEFWDNLLAGDVTVDQFDDDVELPDELRRMAGGARHVAIGGVLRDAERFDGAFFGISPKESDLLDPQHRVFLEVAYQAFQNAAITPGALVTGVFAGSAFPSYLLTRLWGSDETSGMGQYWLSVGNDKDHLATRLAYTLGLTGPAISVQTACSTSLVALHLACQSLLIGECDVAVAGASAIGFPQHRGYHVVEGGILSPDGTCRPFDARASGTIPSSGVGAVVLRRLDDALAANDPIRAIIRGTALTNDGSAKLSYSSPSVPGQVRVIRDALRVAGVTPDEVGYVEAHGTATNLGDAIEIAALKQALDGERPCIIGAVKANVGHLDVAAGVAGLIKTVLALESEVIPGTANFETPSPRLELEGSRFTVTAEPTPWPRSATPRVAGVSSFGLGGTNVHVVLTEPPVRRPAPAEDRPVVLALSAGTEAALADHGTRLAALPLDDLGAAARSLLARRPREVRAAVVASSAQEARAGLAQVVGRAAGEGRVALVFSGAGKYFSAATGALQDVPAFAEAYAEAETALRAAGAEVRRPGAETDDRSDLPTVALPTLFATQYALARTWQWAGVRVGAVVGHSNGEFAAAVVAGAMDVTSAARLVHRRATLLEGQAPGSMVAIAVDQDRAEQLAEEAGVFLAARNTPESHVFSGTRERIDALVEIAQQEGLDARRLGIATAAHSSLLDGAAQELGALAAEQRLSAAAVPFVSGALGRVLSAAEAADPTYWGDHLRRPVLFADAVTASGALADVFVEIGPAGSVAPLVLANLGLDPRDVVASVPSSRESVDAGRKLLDSAGRLWSAGAEIDLGSFLDDGPRIALPAARFDGPVHTVAPQRRQARAASTWETRLQEPVWQGVPPSVALVPVRGRWAVVGGESGLRESLASELRATTEEAVVDLGSQVDGLDASALDGIVHLALPVVGRPDTETFRTALDVVLSGDRDGSLTVVTVAAGAAEILPRAGLDPGAALAVGPSTVAGHELSDRTTRLIDVDPDDPDLARTIVRGIRLDVPDPVLAMRAGQGWVRRWQRLEGELSESAPMPSAVLITGGLGGVGAAVARRLAAKGVPRIALIGRQALEDGDGARERAERLAAVSAEGAEVVYLPCDVTSPDDVQAVVDHLVERWGGVDTLVHAAGVPAGGLIRSRTSEQWELVLAPKTTGTRNLADALRNAGLRRVLLCSSLDAVLGTIGQVDHVAANAFLDAVPASRLFGDALVTSVNWGTWRDAGQAADTSRAGGLTAWREQALEQGMSSEEGAEYAWRVLRSTVPRVAVTGDDIDQVLADMRETDLVDLFSEPDEMVTGRVMRPRSLPQSTFIEPEGPEQEFVAEQWSLVTGISPIGADDDYFAIGGHSLGAIALVSRLRETFPFPIALTDVLERPTVREQGDWLRERLGEYVESLTDDEVEARLAQVTAEDPDRKTGDIHAR